MSPSSHVSIALLGFLLAAPAVAAPSGQAPVAPSSASAAVSNAVPEGFAFAPDGTTLIHVASGLRFPANFKGFKRLKEQANDPSGQYVAISYAHPLRGSKESVVVRFAVVQIDEMSAHDHYLIMRQAAMSHFSAPTIVSEGPVKIPTDPKLDAYRGTFSGTRDNQPWRFSLTTVDYGHWSGRMTAAYPQSNAAEAEQYLGVLLTEVRAQTPKALGK
ncbi:hypothetical protein WBP06_21670 [Novosphingobium sp. BL-8H]|uniref:hypothetical protein n=1 Tax=Novosphingobium sp. BL-8H TaxID=3127640 RepID=UPI003757FFCF